jgi:parvulin-like peptidyl-prolyl isomerase
MKILKTLVLMTVAIAFAAGCGGSTKSGKVLVEINGDKITEGDLELLGEINPRIQRQLESPDGKQRILETVVEQELLYQKAMQEGLNRGPEIKAKVDLYRQVIIAQTLVDKTVDGLTKEYYDKHPDEFNKLKLSAIMINIATPKDRKKATKGRAFRTEEEAHKLANEVKAKIDGGMSFDEAAKKYSDDFLTRERGGNMGLVSLRDQMMIARGFKPLLEKAFTMKVGEIAGPIKTSFSYNIITVTRGAEVEPYDEAKESIAPRMQTPARNKLLAGLKKDSRIVYTEEAEEKKEAETGAEAKGTAEKAAKVPTETTEKK